MRRGLKVLALCAASFALTGTVSGCSATWNEVTDFLNGMYTTIDVWEGMRVESTFELLEKSEWTRTSGVYGMETTETITSYTDTKSHEVSEYKIKDGISYSTTTRTSSDHYGDGSKYDETYKTYYNGSHSYVSDETKNKEEGESATKKTSYYSRYYGTTLSDMTYSLGRTLSSLISTYTNSSRTASYFGVISADVSNRSVSWTMYENAYATTTITIKTDKNYLVNYYCEEYSYFYNPSKSYLESTNSSYTSKYEKRNEKVVYERISGGKISRPSWVNKSNFGDDSYYKNDYGSAATEED